MVRETDGVSGQLDVLVDGKIVYSKQQLGRYTFDEAVRAVADAAKGTPG